jgi:S-formylglutathione hydrolase FrmB
MKRTVRFAALVVLTLSAGVFPAWSIATGRQAAAPTWPAAAGSIVETKVLAAGLDGNRLGDPPEVRVAVYVPPSYATAPQRRYPTLYLLHGFMGDVDAFLAGYQGMQLGPTLDDHIARGAMREMIVVVPSGRNAYDGSFYVNSATTGQWEDFFVRDLVAWVDGHYRTLGAAESRGIAGHSMGGYGAITLAMKHPDVFGAVYALSPCCLALEGDVGPDNPAWQRVLRLKSRDEIPRELASFSDFFVKAFVGLSAAFSPAPSAPPLFAEFPFKAHQRVLVPNEPAYTAWRAKMPLYLVEQYRTNLLKLRGIYLDVGTLEEFSHIRTGTQALSNELAARGIGHTFEVYANGTHSSHIRQRIETRLLRFFSEVLTIPAA